MTQVLDFPQFSNVKRRPLRQGRTTRRDEDASDDFWPEVSRQTVPDDAPVDAANTPKRVLFEVFLVLAAAAGALAAVTFLVPAISP